MKNPFKKQVKSLDSQFDERRFLLRPFLRKYKTPIIVHSVHDKNVFYKILMDGKIKLPSKHNSRKKTPYFEKFIGNEDCIYYSMGFVYYSSYKWKFNLIFDLNYLKELKYYYTSLGFKCYKRVIDYWYDNDKDYFDKLLKYNSKTKFVMNRYLNESYKGSVREILEFWKIEKEIFNFILKYKKRKILFEIMKKAEKEIYLGYPYSKKHAIKYCLTNKAPEILSNKDNDLVNSPYFVGFFIEGHIDKKMLDILKNKYSDKIIFDGKKIKRIK